MPESTRGKYQHKHPEFITELTSTRRPAPQDSYIKEDGQRYMKIGGTERRVELKSDDDWYSQVVREQPSHKHDGSFKITRDSNGNLHVSSKRHG